MADLFDELEAASRREQITAQPPPSAAPRNQGATPVGGDLFDELEAESPHIIPPDVPITPEFQGPNYQPGRPQQRPEATLGEQAAGTGEAALSTLTGMTGGAIGYMGGTIAGIVDEIRRGEFGKGIAEERARKYSSALTYRPRTESGQQQAQAVGEVLQQIPPVIPQAAEAAMMTRGPMRGITLIDEMGEPTKELRQALDKRGLTFENLSPEARQQIPSVITQGIVEPKAAATSGLSEKAMITQIKAGARDDSLAGFKVVNNRIEPDKVAEEAIRQGFEPGFVQAVKTANPQTRRAMGEMLTKMERITKNRRLALDFRPTDVIGNAVLERVDFIRDRASKARIELDKVARTELKGREINPDPIVERLAQALDDYGVRLESTQSGVPKPIFKESLISKDRTSQRIVKDLIDLMAEGGRPDALRFHNLKRQLDILIDFNKKSAGGLTDAGRNILKDVRYSLNQSIREVSPRYAQTNDILSSSLDALNNFGDVIGKSIDVFGPNANKAIGTDLRGLMSNRKTRIRLENSLNQLDSTANELGGRFSLDYKDLALFANGLEGRFGAVAQASFKGDIEAALNATQRAAGGGVAGAARDIAFDTARKATDKLRGINDFNAFSSMRDLINRK